VVIATPNYLHAPQTIAALEAGIHVMVEKPMAMNSAEAEAMAEASRRSGALLMVAHCWRFDVETRWLHQQVQSGGWVELCAPKDTACIPIGDRPGGLHRNEPPVGVRWLTWAFMPWIPPAFCWAIHSPRAFMPALAPSIKISMWMTRGDPGQLG
jgi:predicted dehydrogenase